VLLLAWDYGAPNLRRESAESMNVQTPNVEDRKLAHDRMMVLIGQVAFQPHSLDLPWFEYTPGERVSFDDIVDLFNGSFPPQASHQVASPANPIAIELRRPARALNVSDVRTVLAWWRGGRYLGEHHLLDHRWCPAMQHTSGALKRAYWSEGLHEGTPEFDNAQTAWERRPLTPC
jgi:hypothetical protein